MVNWGIRLRRADWRVARVALGAWFALALAPTVAHGAVCADYPNQKAAQVAKDTRDADGDGIYCEALPCPCLQPGQTGGGSTGGGGRPRPVVSSPRKPRKPKYVPPREISSVTITSVIDGDTVNARTEKGGYVRVRLLGIDAPEQTALRNGAAECGGQGAATALEAFRSEHARVTLVTDRSQARYDRYGRLLAYVEPDELAQYSTYQTYMLANGWAEVYVDRDVFRRFTSFNNAAMVGSTARAGVWSACSGNFHLPI